MSDETACPVKGLSGQLTATDSIVGADGLMGFDERCREQFAHHVVEGVGLHIHRLSYLPLILIGHYPTFITQHLRESVDDVEWCTDLVRHILHELRLSSSVVRSSVSCLVFSASRMCWLMLRRIWQKLFCNWPIRSVRSLGGRRFS